jgi:hypothetical protein
VGRGRFAVRVLLALVVLACALRVGFGTKAWETPVAQQVAHGKLASLDEYMAYGFWYGCLFSGLAALLLLVTSRWWLADGRAKRLEITQVDASGLSRRGFYLVLAGILVLAALPRVARMGQSFWGDEDWAYRDLIGGRFREAQDGSLKFKRHEWKVTAFWDKGTNNQYAYTLLARACHDGWKRISGARPEQFEEWVLRVPSLLAGLGSIAMGALLLRRMGFSKAALYFAALLAIHPWHVRYSSEARGYTMLIFFLLAGIYFLLAALERGHWRHWLLFALCEFLALYSWKAALHPIAALNLGVFVVLLVKRREALQYARWLVVNIAVLMLFVPLFAPAIPQIRRKLAVSTQAHGQMGLQWFEDVLAQLVDGADWAIQGYFALTLAVFATVVWVVGFLRIRSDQGWIVLLAPLAGAVLAYFHFCLSGNELLKWYLFYTLPFLLIFVALGLERSRILKAIFLTLYFLGAASVLHARMTFPIQPSREAALRTRNAEEGTLQMGPTDIVTVGLFRASQSYDPRMRQARDLRSGVALLKIAEECRAEGKKLRVSAANLGFARENHQSFFEVLDDANWFRKTGEFPAAEAYLEIETYEMVE